MLKRAERGARKLALQRVGRAIGRGGRAIEHAMGTRHCVPPLMLVGRQCFSAPSSPVRRAERKERPIRPRFVDARANDGLASSRWR